MRLASILAFGVMAGCTSNVTVPVTPGGMMEVTPPGTAMTSTSGIDGGLPQTATPLNDDRLNLTLYTIEQQKIDAAIAERELENARSQLVVVQPGALPDRVEGVNVALFAKQTTNPVGQRVYQRSGGGFSARSSCGRFPTADDAQRAFLSAGGPATDRYGLDPDGDGFACGWDPTPYRAL
jgi:hypothetical protein